MFLADSNAAYYKLGEISIVKMQESHIPEIHKIEKVEFNDPWSERLLRSELKLDRLYLVAELKGEVVGYGGVGFFAGEAHILNLATKSEFKRMGIGLSITVLLLAYSSKIGIESATLEVRVSNDAAKHLYEKVGFVPVGIRPNYYVKENEDALIMWIHDLSSEASMKTLINLLEEAN